MNEFLTARRTRDRYPDSFGLRAIRLLAVGLLAVGSISTVFSRFAGFTGERAVCRALGIAFGQGYLLGRPAPMGAGDPPPGI